MQLHCSVEDLRQSVNPRILPKEYGGEVPLAEMIADFKAELRRKRDDIRALDDMTIDVTGPTLLEDDLAGTFRKLEVD